MSRSNIEWCDYTLNPVVGCSKCSPGCLNCYAEKMAHRHVHNPQTRAKYADVIDASGKWNGKQSKFDFSVFKRLPKKPQRVFIGSMTDIFLQDVEIGTYSKSYLPLLFDCMASHPQHTFMLLTKRPENARQWIEFSLNACVDDPLPNLWLGVTVCNQAEADEKIPMLLDIPAAIRFISFEPLLGSVSLWRLFPEGACKKPAHEAGRRFVKNSEYENGIHWVICGAETGPKKRPMNTDWAVYLRNQCKDAGVPFFFKKDSQGNALLAGEMVREFPDEVRQ